MGKVYIFPYLRKGLANYIDKDEDTKGKKRAEIQVGLKVKASTVNNTDDSFNTDEFVKGKSIELLGPSDIKMLSSNAIIRMSPAETGDIRINCKYSPFIEFYEEDLPWRYTPLAADHPDFHPWMALIAVKEDEMKVSMHGSIKIVELNLTAERYIEVFPTSKVLKDVAHVQIDTKDDRLENNSDESRIEKLVNEILEENPDCGISRILCSSKLEPSTVYNILLIPSYELGRLAALDLSIDSTGLNTCAWSSTLEEQMKRPNGMTFPLYKKWKITTSFGADNFITLAKKLFHTSEKEYEEMRAYLDVDIAQSGLISAHVESENAVIDVPASLIVNEKPTNLREEDDDYRQILKETLMLNPVLSENESEEIDMESDPWIVPPVYGARHKLITKTEFENNTINDNHYNIVNDVNLRMRNRIVAGLGAQIVKKNQEQFVNRAWKKVEVVNTVNQVIREYYQMNQVNECAKERSPRTDIFNQKDKVTEKTIGLLSDAALKMLQSSGIYYNSVAPDKMLMVANTEMNKQENPISKIGLPREFLLELYDPKQWEGARREGIILDKIKETTGKNSRLGDSAYQTFSEYAFLDKFLYVRWKNDKAYFCPRLTDKDCLALDDASYIYHPLTGWYDTAYDICSAVQRVKENGEYYFYINSLIRALSLVNLNKKGVLYDSTKVFNYVNVRPINVVSKQGYGYILEGNSFSNKKLDKPLAIEYQRDNDKKEYLFFITKDYFDKRINNVKYSLRYKQNSYSCELNRNGGFSVNLPDEPSSPELDIYKFNSYSKFLFDEISYTIDTLREAMRDYGRWFHDDYNKEKRKSTLKKFPWSQFCIFQSNKTIGFSFKKIEHPWQIWNFMDAFDKNIIRSDNNLLTYYYSTYIYAIEEIRSNLSKFENILYQPTHIDVGDLDLDDFSIIRANELVKDVQKTENDIDLSTDELLTKIKAEYANIKRKFADRKTPAAKVEDKDHIISDEIPNPDQLAKDRIVNIVNEYGITEVAQLKDNFNSKYPIMVYPDFLDPTFFYLRELSVNYVLPGAGELLKNTISCFYSNPAFEEALLMGMNTEMGHELLWREYPTDQRGSYFRKFWDQSELPKKDELDKYFDVEPLHNWDSLLGKNHMQGKSQMLVFAIKGELMQVFPDTDIYLREKDTDRVLKACMSSWLTEDTYLVGFQDIKKEYLYKYYLVFEQMPMSLQFDQKDGAPINNSFNVVKPCIFAIPAGQKPV